MYRALLFKISGTAKHCCFVNLLKIEKNAYFNLHTLPR